MGEERRFQSADKREDTLCCVDVLLMDAVLICSGLKVALHAGERCCCQTEAGQKQLQLASHSKCCRQC